MSSLKKQGTKAFLWDFFGKIARHGTTFIVTIVLARLLEPSDFGLIAMIMVIVMVALVFTDVGLGSALIQRRRLLPVHYASVFYFNIFIGLLLTLITFLSATWISVFYENKALISITQVMALLFIINAFSSVQISKLRKELNYAALAKADVTAALLSGVIGILLAFYDAGVWSLVVMALSRGIFYNIFVWGASKWVPSLLFSFKALGQLWGFGFRMFLSNFIETVYTHLDIIIIGKIFSPAVLGFFDQAKRLNLMITQLSSGSIMAVLFPVLSKVQNDLPRFQNIVIKTLGIISFITFFLLGFMYLIAEELIVLLFTEKWLTSAEYFKILVLSGFGYPISALLVGILSSRGNSKAFLKVEIYKKILLSLNLYVGFLWGIEGYLYGLIVVTFLALSLNIAFASQEIKLHFFVFVRPVLSQMAISVFAVLITVLIYAGETSIIISMLIKGFVFTISYLFVSKLFKTSSYLYTMDQIVPLINRIVRKNTPVNIENKGNE